MPSKRMTLDAFIKAMPKQGWYFYNGMNHVRQNGELMGELHCPITAVALKRGKGCYNPVDWASAAEAIGLPWRLARKIVSAADFKTTNNPAIRRRLLKAMRLKEKAG